MYKRFIVLVLAVGLILTTTPSGAQQAAPVPGVQTQNAVSQKVSTSPASPVTPPQAAQERKPNTLLDGTPVKLRLGRTMSSSSAKVGEEVDFEVLEDLKVDGVVVIAKGGLAMATVTDAEHKKSMGRAGKMDINIDSVRLVDEEKAALRATEGGKAGGHVGAMTGAMVATSIVFFPAAPLFLFIHGKDLTIPKGTEITAYVNGDMTLDMSKFMPATGAPVSLAAQSQVSIDSNIPNCDIEVDGAFVGNTPSQLSLAPGKHDIAVKKKGYVTWSRTMMVSGSGVHLNAELDTAAVSPTPAPTKN